MWSPVVLGRNCVFGEGGDEGCTVAVVPGISLVLEVVQCHHDEDHAEGGDAPSAYSWHTTMLSCNGKWEWWIGLGAGLTGVRTHVFLVKKLS